jgi:sigma-E factor negative regulatory protein RseA
VVATVSPAATVTPASLESEPVVADVRLIRDAQLDRYLAAHKQFAGSSALGVPSAFLRGATVDAPASR